MPADTVPSGLTSWTGWDLRGKAVDESSALDELAHTAPDGPDTEAYELIAVAARGFRPPRFLTAVALPGVSPTDERSVRTDVPEDAGTAHEGLRQTWRVVYRCIAETAPRQVDPYAVYLLGVNPPPDVSDEELVEFNHFYTDVHLPEVAERRHALRGVRYELVHEVRAPYRGAPRFLALYEVDEESASHRRHSGPPYARGPEVWQRHTTPWRLWYRRLAA